MNIWREEGKETENVWGRKRRKMIIHSPRIQLSCQPCTYDECEYHIRTDTHTHRHTRHPHLFFNILKRGWRYDRETDQEYVSLRIRERSKTIVVLLTYKQDADSFVNNVKEAGGGGNSPAVSNRPSVYGSPPIMTVTA